MLIIKSKKRKAKKEINGLKEPESKTISPLFIFNSCASEQSSQNGYWSVHFGFLDIYSVSFFVLLIWLTCLEETCLESTVEMEELVSCNPSGSMDARSPEPQDVPPQKKKKKSKKMAHTFGNQFRWTPWTIFPILFCHIYYTCLCSYGKWTARPCEWRHTNVTHR